jgi:hypothetical protein
MILHNVGMVQVLQQINLLHYHVELSLWHIRESDLLDSHCLSRRPIQSRVHASKSSPTQAMSQLIVFQPFHLLRMALCCSITGGLSISQSQDTRLATADRLRLTLLLRRVAMSSTGGGSGARGMFRRATAFVTGCGVASSASASAWTYEVRAFTRARASRCRCRAASHRARRRRCRNVRHVSECIQRRTPPGSRSIVAPPYRHDPHSRTNGRSTRRKC